MRAELKEEQYIDLIGKNEVYGDTRHEGTFVLLVFTGIWGFKPREHYVALVQVEPCMHRNKRKGDEDAHIFVP